MTFRNNSVDSSGIFLDGIVFFPVNSLVGGHFEDFNTLDRKRRFSKRSVNKCNQEMDDSLPKLFRDDASFLFWQQPADGLRQTTAYDLSDLPGRPDKQEPQRAALKPASLIKE